MIEPYPTNELIKRCDPQTVESLQDRSYDFIYLDGDHSYAGVKQEMFYYWPKVRNGGMMAGHDYCNFGEQSLVCSGCSVVPKCLPYTEYGIARGKKNGPLGTAANENDVVRAVQEWMAEMNDPRLTLRYTREDFTRESLAQDDMDYELVITNTRTPSWYILKPF
ncbi:unnamed protein product [Cylindrotheca closterium]|uniref:Class I SAM-dependent methyltransferase n=1 Tax=Cylindrotheca closterium TaxID=2856 RepID=A0AAD2FG62_9STRA|nr:unnamed protein product [Cylindrotheca closterium]